MATIASLSVSLTAATKGFEAGLKKATSVVSSFAGSIGGFARSAGGFLTGILGNLISGFWSLAKAVGGAIVSFVKWGSIGAAAVVAGLTAIFFSVGNTIDSFAKLNDRIGVNVASFTRLATAFELADVESETAAKGLVKLQNNVADAARGTGSAVKTFQELGLSAKALIGLGADEQFIKIAGAMQNVNSDADKTRIALDLFGKSGVELLGVLNEGEGALRKYANLSDRLGLTVGTKGAQGVAKMNDAITTFKNQAVGLARQLVVQLAPSVSKLVERATAFTQGWIRAHGGIKKIATAISQFVLGAFERLGEFFSQFAPQAETAFNAIATASQQWFNALISAIPTVVSWIAFLIAGFLSFVTWFVGQTPTIIKWINTLIVAFGILAQWVVQRGWPIFKEWFMNMKRDFLDFIASAQQKWDEFSPKLLKVFQDVQAMLPTFQQMLTSIENFGTQMSMIWESIKVGFTAVQTAIADALFNIDQIWQKLSNFATLVVEIPVLNTLIDSLAFIEDKLKDILIPGHSFLDLFGGEDGGRSKKGKAEVTDPQLEKTNTLLELIFGKIGTAATAG